MKCGEKGWKTAAGEPCQQNISRHAIGCLWHSRTPQERAVVAQRGAVASRMKSLEVLAESTPLPELDDDDGRGLIRETIQQVRTGKLDPRRAEVVLGGVVKAAQLKAAREAAKGGSPGITTVNIIHEKSGRESAQSPITAPPDFMGAGLETNDHVRIGIPFTRALPGANVDDWIKQPDWLEPHDGFSRSLILIWFQPRRGCVSVCPPIERRRVAHDRANRP
jgi:hypothetical protein